jgi:[heparan sulfate]-glucosamine 3-sulfotransferase 5
MKMWLKYFPLAQFHIVNGDRLIKKPWQEVVRVEKFLRVDHQVMTVLVVPDCLKNLRTVY